MKTAEERTAEAAEREVKRKADFMIEMNRVLPDVPENTDARKAALDKFNGVDVSAEKKAIIATQKEAKIAELTQAVEDATINVNQKQQTFDTTFNALKSKLADVKVDVKGELKGVLTKGVSVSDTVKVDPQVASAQKNHQGSSKALIQAKGNLSRLEFQLKAIQKKNK